MWLSLYSILAHGLLCCQAAPWHQTGGDSWQGLESQAPERATVSSSRQPRSSISSSLFAELERLARLVDISYCIGNTGVRKPFECLSRCSEFPELSLETTWSTGFLMGDSCGYIALDHDNGAILVAFRGTYSIANAMIDLSTVPQKYVPYPAPDDGDGDADQDDAHSSRDERKVPGCNNCTVHMGFLQSWQLARETVMPKLKALKEDYPSHQMQLVGHSLGGAVACLAALEMKLSLGWEDVLVTTFGEPRVGNSELARYIDEAFSLDGTSHLEHGTYRRVTHSNDPVPLLPPEEWGYRSHGGEVYIAKQHLRPSEGDVRTCVGDADPECSSGAETPLLQGARRLLHFASSSASVDEYIAARTVSARLKLRQLFFAHRDYFWRLGLCVPGGDPANWEMSLTEGADPDEL